MLSVVLDIAFVAFGLALALTAWRLFKGPDTVDRLLALDTLYTNGLGLTVLVGIRIVVEGFASRSWYFELAVLVALMGFVGTVAGARFLSRGDAIE